MSTIKYAYLKGHTWLYRRNYPLDVALVLGAKALKQSLRTGDTRTARVRASEVNVVYETQIEKVRSGVEEAQTVPPRGNRWGSSSNDALALLRATIGADGAQVAFTVQSKAPKLKVGEASRAYLGRRSDELRHGGFKSVRYSVGLFTSKYHDQALVALGREDGRAFLGAIARLSPVIGKSESTRGLGLDQLVAYSSQGHRRITPRTQRRIWSQVLHFLDWAVYEGQLEQNSFRTVRFEGKVVPAPYAVPTDAEVSQLLAVRDRRLHALLITCLLTGMRAGEAAGLLRADLIDKGNLGTFVHVRPNSVRQLKTRTSERVVPVHADLEVVLAELPAQGRLFPDLTVNDVTKRFAVLRRRLGLERAGLVFHSTRKWFVTQCERTGVPEHFTASLVGHQSARSENGLTYGIYSAGISDDQKRGIIDQIRLPS